MPISYTVDRERGRVDARATGRITYDDVAAHLDAEERDRAEGYKELFDARGATTDLTADQVRRLADHARRSAERGRTLGATAIVADNDAMFGMARMYAMLCEFVGAQVEVFRAAEPAGEWLARLPDGGAPGG